MSDTAGLTYPCGDRPDIGTAREVADGVWWSRMPLPFELEYINVWALRDASGWLLVDTGIWSADAVSAWRQLLAEQFNGPVTRVCATHMHPDHIGLAGWLTRRFDCPLSITRQEYLTCRLLVGDTGREAPEEATRFYRRAGWDEEAIETYRTRFGGFGKMVYALPDSYQRLRDGDQLQIDGRAWRVVVGEGHSPEHACLYCPDMKLLISGDQVLPRISSNVSVFPTEPGANPLAAWLDSIDKLQREIPDDVLVLPAHNEPFRGLHQRLDALRQGHMEGLSRLREKLHEPRRVIDVFDALFKRPITGHALMSLATGESLAHLNYLVERGEATVQPGSDGCHWYQLAG